MAVSEAVRRIVFDRDGGKCQLFHHVPVEGTEYFHVKHQGMGGASEDADVNQASNGLVACRACHSMFHQLNPWRVLAFDPEQGILDIVGPDEKPVPRGGLWFHGRQEWARAQATLEWFRDSIAALRRLQWGFAGELLALYENKAYLAGGYLDLYEFTHELGLSSAKAKRMMRLYRFASAYVKDPRVFQLDPDIVSLLRRVPQARMEEMIATFLENPLPVALEMYNNLYGEERMKIFRAFRSHEGRVVYEELRALSEDEIRLQEGDIVMRGGSVIRGAISHQAKEEI